MHLLIHLRPPYCATSWRLGDFSNTTNKWESLANFWSTSVYLLWDLCITLTLPHSFVICKTSTSKTGETVQHRRFWCIIYVVYIFCTALRAQCLTGLLAYENTLPDSFLYRPQHSLCYTGIIISWACCYHW